MSEKNSPFPSSPFHRGEQAIQSRLGVRDRMERFGSRVIRDHMPAQHQEFYGQLPFIFAGHADKDGWPWASILFNSPGFIHSPNAKTLDIQANPIQGDPLAETLNEWSLEKENLENGVRLGLLGVELTSRRRNRLAAHVTRYSDDGVQLEIDQAFGNCPQYIQTRELEMLDPSTLPPASVKNIAVLDDEAQTLIANSDTFFVASYIKSDDRNNNSSASEGADVSHRGGQAGFVRVDNKHTLTIPDYLGNNHFNTFGNFVENSKAGLLFIDFESGHILTLTGTVEIIWNSSETKYFEGAERLWKFHIDHGRWIHNSLPLRWKLDEFSPNSLLTGTWDEADKMTQAQAHKDQWLPYEIARIVEESSLIKSFYLKAKDHQALKFLPGQFLTIKTSIKGKELIRNYSLSSAPADSLYRISVKREQALNSTLPDGIFSSHIHQQLKVGDTLYAKAPRGSFTFDENSQRPAVLLAGGVGITPMISMARHALNELIRTRSGESLTFIGAAKDHQQRAFFDELSDLEKASSGQIRAFWSLSNTDPSLKPGKDFHNKGRISAELLQAILPLDDYDFYLCGPSGFMQSSYDLLRRLGVRDSRIQAEEFGPASLKRDVDITSKAFEPQPIAAEAVIEFTGSKVEQAWSKEDGTLLEFAEAHGFSPEFSCRSGQCGACKTTLVSGEVTYLTEHSAPVNENEVLLCCAVPAAVEDQDLVKLALKL
jgi:ferredoxin-NADP reductase/predicted pyridoxine 5'-phosphate oxidase superfamily flavin-nucleotide-binding protein